MKINEAAIEKDQEVVRLRWRLKRLRFIGSKRKYLYRHHDCNAT